MGKCVFPHHSLRQNSLLNSRTACILSPVVRTEEARGNKEEITGYKDDQTRYEQKFITVSSLYINHTIHFNDYSRSI